MNGNSKGSLLLLADIAFIALGMPDDLFGEAKPVFCGYFSGPSPQLASGIWQALLVARLASLLIDYQEIRL